MLRMFMEISDHLRLPLKDLYHLVRVDTSNNLS